MCVWGGEWERALCAPLSRAQFSTPDARIARVALAYGDILEAVAGAADPRGEAFLRSQATLDALDAPRGGCAHGDMHSRMRAPLRHAFPNTSWRYGFPYARRVRLMRIRIQRRRRRSGRRRQVRACRYALPYSRRVAICISICAPRATLCISECSDGAVWEWEWSWAAGVAPRRGTLGDSVSALYRARARGGGGGGVATAAVPPSAARDAFEAAMGHRGGGGDGEDNSIAALLRDIDALLQVRPHGDMHSRVRAFAYPNTP